MNRRDATSEFFDYCRFFFNEIDDSAIQYFVSSFSSLRDSVKLWSRYGSKGKGVAIGFETGRLEGEPSDPSSFFVARVTYTPSQQIDLLSPLLFAAKNVLSSYIARFGYDVCDAAVQMFASKLCSHLNHHSISLKSENWNVEHEWRTVFPLLRNDPEERKKRVNARSDGRPYVDVPVRSAGSGNLRMPIAEVIAGSEADAQAIRKTLDGLGYRSVPVSISAVTAADIASVDSDP